MKNNRKKIFIFSLISFFFGTITVCFAFFSIRHLPQYDYSVDDWKSEYAEYRDNGFSVNDDLRNSTNVLYYEYVVMSMLFWISSQFSF